MFGRLRSLGPDFSLRLVFALMRQGLPFGHAAMFLQSIGTPEAADALLAIAREDPAKAGVALAGAAEGMQDPDPREGRKPWAPGGLQALLDILDSMRPCPAAIREDLLARLRLEEWFCRTARPEDARLLGERLRSAKQTDERFLFAAVLCRLKPAGEKTWWESSPLEGEAGELVRDLVLLSLGAGGAAGRVKAALESCETGWKRAAARCLARAGTAEALAILEVLFDDPEESVREQVADALAGAGAEGLRALLSRLGPASLQGAFDRIQSRKEALDREALEKFVQTVVDSELEDEHAKDLLRESAGALARKGPPPGPRLAAWLEEAAAGKKTARQERLVVLVEFLRGGIPEEDCPAGWLPLIEKQLESEDWSRRNWALTRLTNMAPEADAALVKALDSRFPDAAWQSARILYVRTAKVHAWKRADGSKKDLVPDVHLEYEHLLFLLRQGRYHEVLDQARGPDAEWSRLAKEALEDSLGEMPEPR
jgi:hypothetical protein